MLLSPVLIFFCYLLSNEDEEEILQMVADIQHALRRIPPEISTFLHNPQADYLQSEGSGFSFRPLSHRTCQTPPTLYQEDTEKFQKIMEENTFRLEASCKQLEMVCTNLQNEKEMTEKELEEARYNVEYLVKKVKDLEGEMEGLSEYKVKQLEDEKRHLESELKRQANEFGNNPMLTHLKKLVEDLKNQKLSSDETCARMEYDMTLLRMEKEKFVTMLAIRDKEIKDIQDEMGKIQEHVNKQLKKLNADVLQKSSSFKNISEIGDTTISSIATNESERDVLMESPAGDGEMGDKEREVDEERFQRLRADSVELNLNAKDDIIFENLLTGLTPSVKSLLTLDNL